MKEVIDVGMLLCEMLNNSVNGAWSSRFKLTRFG